MMKLTGLLRNGLELETLTFSPGQMADLGAKKGLSSWGTPLTSGPLTRVTEKNEQHVELCKMLDAEGYDVMLLPVVQESSKILLKCLGTKEMDTLNAR
jgi:hypothetical protein